MTWLVQPRLVNGPFDDPGAILDFRFGRRAILFDLGDLGALPAREVARVSHAFVSHAHMDHFAGFDRLLRLALHRPGPLTLVGPGGFVEQVERRIGSYSWNLLGPASPSLVLHVAEFAGGRLARAAEFPEREAFRRRDVPAPVLPDGCVLDEPDLAVTAVELDHGIPSLAFRLQERRRVNVMRGALDARGLAPGPWLADAKAALRRGAPDDASIATPTGPVTLGDLRDGVLREGPGQAVAYVTDAIFHAENARRIVSLARGADQLLVEAVFLEEDAAVAASRGHLTAAQAGRLAREAGARHATPFHHSPRYLDRPDALREEFERAFREG
jgi:ribonuclease Z